jgi:hypothetical protein
MHLSKRNLDTSVSFRRNLTASPESSQGGRLVAVDIEERVQPGELKKVLHPLVDVDKLKLASPLPDDGITPDQLAHTIAVNQVHAREIKQELSMSCVAEDVDQVTQLRATVNQGEPPNRVNDDDSVKLSCSDRKTHGESATICFHAESYIGGVLLSTTAESAGLKP